MADADQVALIRDLTEKARARVYDGGTLLREELPLVALEIGKEWSALRSQLPKHLDLESVDFSNTVFCGIDLEEANLGHANFSRSVLFACEFRGSHLEGACFDSCDITDVFFHAACLIGAGFRGAHMRMPSFTQADLTGACFDEAVLHGVRIDPLAVLTGASFRGCTVSRVAGRKDVRDLMKCLSATQKRQIVREGACFIATAACGGTDAWEVRVLRTFRDRVLLRSGLGEHVVEAYYRWSPPLARRIQTRPGRRAAVRRGLVRPAAHLASALLGRDLTE